MIRGAKQLEGPRNAASRPQPRGLMVTNRGTYVKPVSVRGALSTLDR